MRFWWIFLTFFFLFRPFSPLGSSEDFDEFKEFDDDSFLSEKTEPNPDGLIGWSLFRSESGEDRYIINFNNVSIIEYLRFVSKISNMNFQFEEAELDFTVTVVSEEPLTIKNILSALIQTLRARGFSVLEQENNLMITRSREINQIPTLIIPSKTEKEAEKAPIVTRVFRIKHANLNSLATILRPMMSQGAMIDVSNETRQLLVTDITTNVDKIAVLLQTLDTPHTSLEVEIYKAHNLPPVVLIELAKQIVAPFAEDYPLIFVPQPESNSIFIVSTPGLIERSMEVFEDLDVKPDKKLRVSPVGHQVYLYKIQNKAPDELLEAIEEIADELEGTGTQSIALVAALESAKYIKESDSILFITDQETQPKIETILKTLDTLSDSRNFYIYKIQEAGREQIEKSLEQLVRSIKKGESDRDLIDTIQSMRYIKETNSFIFTGTDESLKKLREILPTFDTSVAEYSPTSHYWLYTPQYLSGKELERALEDLEDNLASSGLADPSLLQAIQSMKWVPSTNTLLFTGTPPALDHIQNIIKLIDIPAGSPSKIFIYKPNYIDNQQIEEALDELADKLDHKNLSDRNLAKAIDDMTWIAESQVFLFKSDPATIDKIENFLKDIDTPKEAETISSAYYLYKLKFANGEDVIDHLETVGANLPNRDPSQKAIIEVIDNVSFLRETNSILLTGTQKAVEEVKKLIEQFDVSGAAPPLSAKTSFFIYKPEHLTAEQLQQGLLETASDLKSAGLVDPTLLQSIETSKVVELTDSMVFTGTKESLEKTKEIIATIDVPGAKADKVKKESQISEVAGKSFFIYKVRYISISQLMKLIQNVITNLEKEGAESNRLLIRVLKSAKELKETNSILFIGEPKILDKVSELVKQLDTPEGLGVPKKEEEKVQPPGDYIVYKPVNVSGPELIDMMCDFKQNLIRSGVSDPPLNETIKNLTYIQKTGYILVSGESKAVEKALELLRKFDVPGTGGAVTSLTQLETSFLVYKLHYHQGTQIQEALKQIAKDLTAADPTTGSKLLNAINSLQWIKMTNSLLATGSPDVLTQLKELIQNIDVPLRQVFIEVLIIQTTIDNNQQFGLQWGGKAQYLNRFAAGTSNFPSPNIGGTQNLTLSQPLGTVNAVRTPIATDIANPSMSAGGFDLGVIGDLILHRGKTFISLASLVNALNQDSDSVVVMNPKIIAQDNQQATIFVGQNIPFTGSIVQTVGNGTGQQTSTNLEYRDVGTSLSITPILGGNDIVTLDITNEISAQVENTTGGGQELQGLQTSRTTLNARVHVPNKHFVALSGMLSDTKTHSKSNIPCLGGLPVIGAIFSDNERFNSRNNIIFFIRPVIIDTIEQFDQISENQECLYKDLGSKQIIKEEIDEGINWVKDPYDDE